MVVDPASTPKTSGPSGGACRGRGGKHLHPVFVTMKRRESLEDRRTGNLRRFVQRPVASEQCTCPTLRTTDSRVARPTPCRQASRAMPPAVRRCASRLRSATRAAASVALSPAARPLYLPCCRAACAGCPQAVASWRLSLCVTSDLQCTEQREASGTTFPVNESCDRLVDVESHPADQLHEELTAARRTFVVRQNIGDRSVCEHVHQKRFATQGSHSVKLASHLSQRTLDRDKLRDVAQMTGYAEIFSVGKLWRREEFLKNLQGASLMGHHFGSCGIGPHRHHLDRKCADIDAYVGHRGFRCASRAAQLRM